jgi:hypothetical protein
MNPPIPTVGREAVQVMTPDPFAIARASAWSSL